MKRLLDAARGLLGLLVLAALGIGLIALLREKPTIGRSSPLASPTTMRAAQSPLITPTPRPTFTRAPAPPTRTPKPTFTPAPPTSTPVPLPTLVPGWQTFVYATTKDGKPTLYRFQVGSAARKVSMVVQVDTRAWPTSRTRVEGLYPSPDGKRVAVAWVYGEGGNSVSILDVNSGKLIPLFGETAMVDQRAFFLAWSPDGKNVLVLGGISNHDLKGNIWLINVDTHKYSNVGIKQTIYDAREITSASFSPDGTAIVYARANCYQCGSEVWRVALDGSDQQLLFKVSDLRVEDVVWSPDGRYIVFTQWRESEAQDLFIGGINSVAAVGELWIMDAKEGERHKLSSVLTGYYKQFGLAWSPDGKQIAFVMSDEAKLGKQLDELHSNVYVADVNSSNVKPLTRFSHVQILAPTWSPDGSMLAFAGNPDNAPGQLELWAMKTDGSATQRIDEERGLTVNANATNVAIVWLP